MREDRGGATPRRAGWPDLFEPPPRSPVTWITKGASGIGFAVFANVGGGGAKKLRDVSISSIAMVRMCNAKEIVWDFAVAMHRADARVAPHSKQL